MGENPFVNRLVEDHRTIKKVLESVIAPRESELGIYLARWKGHEKMEETKIFPILDDIFRGKVASSEDAMDLVRRAKDVSSFVREAEEDHKSFREFVKKYDEVLPEALKERLKAHIDLEDMIVFPMIRGMAEKG